MPHPDPLPEFLRREYLQALGIDCYMPRVQLPGAPVSALASIALPDDITAEPVAETASDIAAEAQQSVSKQNGPDEQAQQAQLVQQREEREQQEHVEHVEDRQASQAEPTRPPVTAPGTSVGRALAGNEKTAVNAVPAQEAQATKQPGEKSGKHREEVKLQLLCIRVGEGKSGAAVIAAMPHLGTAQLSARHQGLLANLLRACGIAVGDMEVEEKPFRWPMVNGLHVDNSRRAAASALKAYLLQKHADWHFGNLLVMGEAVVSPLFEPVEDKDSEQVTNNRLEQGQWNLVYTRSLDELLQSPTLKKEAWLDTRKRFTR